MIKNWNKVSSKFLIENENNFLASFIKNKDCIGYSIIDNSTGEFYCGDSNIKNINDIINEYQIKNKSLLYHFDFYRIKTIDELVEIGFDEYVYSNKICFIEWPQIAMKLIPRKFIKVKIDINKNLKRNINITMN